MPVYEYLCEPCGPFEELRPMAEFELPQPCPDCGRAAPRVLLTVPGVMGMSSERRAAFATNERSAHAPRLSKKSERESKHKHGPGCGCGAGGGKRPSRTVTGRDGSKSFPSARPWMISH